MKTLRRSFTMLICIGFAFMLASCSGYNAVMCRHLSNAENYAEYSGVISDIYWYDDDEKISFFDSGETPKGEVIFEISFSAADDVRTFLGSDPGQNIEPADYVFQYDVTEANSAILAENGFYDAVIADAPIEIITSSFIYMDTDFYFIAAVCYDDTAYLPFDTGFSNITAYIGRNKSIF